MIAGIIIIVISLILSVIFIKNRKKMSLGIFLSFMTSSLLVIVIAISSMTWIKNQEENDKKNCYVALKYMESNRLDEAGYYLENTQQDIFETNAVEILLEYMKGNDKIAQLKYDGIKALNKKDDKAKILKKLKELSSEEYSQLQEMVVYFLNHLDISQEIQEQAEIMYAVASGNYNDDVQKYLRGLEEEDRLRTNINRELSNEDYQKAVETAIKLIEFSASSKNRLLLAETIAEATYSGWELSYDTFQTDRSYKDEDGERIKLEDKLDDMNEQMEEIQKEIARESNEEQRKILLEEKDQLSASIEILQSEYDYIYIHRAFNSIADIHTLEASIVRARLYFAMRDYENAMGTLLNASSSLGARLESNAKIRNAMNIFNETYNSQEAIGSQSEEFVNAMTILVSAGMSDSVAVSTCKLTKDFAAYIGNEQKNYGKKLYISSINTDAFPEITVTLNGEKAILEEITKKSELVKVKDTRSSIPTYEVLALAEKERQSNICCIIDQSGSMSGDPMLNLKTALISFINALDKETAISLVGFENGYTHLYPMSTDHSGAREVASNLYANGGTNITAGIQGGIEACQNVALGSKILLLMTDGQSSVDMQIVEMAAQQGFTIHTIGFGDVNDQLLQNIADICGGQYIKAESAEELVNVYLSLAGTIGNTIKIKYTAKNKEIEQNRYFFLHSEKQQSSVRVQYGLGKEEGSAVYKAYPLSFSKAQIDSMAASNQQLNIRLNGKNLKRVESVTVGGKEAVIVENGSGDETLVLQVPAQLSEGWQNIVVTETSGEEKVYENMLVVGEYLNSGTYKIGKLNMKARSSMLLQDGTLVILGSDVTDKDDNNDSEYTLNMNVDGLLSLKVTNEIITKLQSGEYSYYDAIELGTEGTLKGTGIVNLTYLDSGYNDRGYNTIAQGYFRLECDSTQAKLIQE